MLITPCCAAVVIIMACMKWFSDPDSPLFLCISFAMLVDFFFNFTFFFLHCEIAHLDGGQMVQYAPKRALTPTSHLAALHPPARVQKAKHHPSLLLSPVSLSFGLTGTVVTLPWLHNLPTTRPSLNLKLITHQCCLANCSSFVSTWMHLGKITNSSCFWDKLINRLHDN